jgi:D-beta-D-heptose 7-phosphate kinase/D-beta-D-heptose 1-phosphate adenosyltransferase
MGKVVRLEELLKLREAFRHEKRKIVFTNGCFDLIHRGHIEYLSKAKMLGDVLIVGVNTDNSVRRMKGMKRPIINEEDRVLIVANLSPVDYVCTFDEDTPMELIRALVPDVLVKGADWNIDDIVGKEIVEQAGGKVVAIELTPGRSTSSIIKLIVERFA